MKHAMKIQDKRFYTTDSMDPGVSVNSLFRVVDQTTVLDPHPGLLLATHHFRKPNYPGIDEIELLSLVVMDLLNQYAYPCLSGYEKFTLSLTMKQSYGAEITFTVGSAIPLTTHDDQLVPKMDIYAHLNRLFLKQAEVYNGSSIVRLTVHVYMAGDKNMSRPSLSVDDRYSSLILMKVEFLNGFDPIPASSIRKIQHRKRNYPGYITALKRKSDGMKPFFVSDLETVLINNVHKVYAGGVMLVRPGQDVREGLIHTYFSEDYSFIIDSFEERSKKLLLDLVNKIITIVKKEKTAKTVYFHNFF